MNLHIKYISYVSSIIVLIFVYVINFYPNYSLNQELHLFETISVGLFVLFAITYRSTNNLKFIFDFLTRIKRSVSKEYSRNKYFLKSISLLFFVLLAAKQLLFINKYTVNMLYWDQWDFYNPLFNNETLWQAFTHQHGPHRQGIGFILTEFLAKESGWNTRWDAFGISFCLIFSAFIAISILLKSSINNAFYLVLVPLAFFTPHSWEMLVGPSNISHGAMPVLLIMLYCLTLFSGKPLSRWFCLLSINFCCVFTGFGLFIGLITPLLAILELIQSIKLRRIHYTAITTISFVLSILTWALFFKDYKFADTAPSGPSTFYSKIKFTALLLSHFYGAVTEAKLIAAMAMPENNLLVKFILIYFGLEISILVLKNNYWSVTFAQPVLSGPPRLPPIFVDSMEAFTLPPTIETVTYFPVSEAP